MDELGTDLRCMLAAGIKIYDRATRLLTAVLRHRAYEILSS